MELLSCWPQQRGQVGLRQGADSHAGMCGGVRKREKERHCVCLSVCGGFVCECEKLEKCLQCIIQYLTLFLQCMYVLVLVCLL